MKPKIKILNELLRLKQINKQTIGKLYGIFVDNTLIILGVQLLNKKDSLDLTYNFPAEIDFCGVFEICVTSTNYQQALSICKTVEVTDNPVYIQIHFGDNDNNDGLLCHVVSNNQINPVEYVFVSKEEIYSEFIHLRVTGQVNFKCELKHGKIVDRFTDLRKNMASGILLFKITELNVLIANNSDQSLIGSNDNPTIGDLFDSINLLSDGRRKKKKSEQFQLKSINIQMFKRMNKDEFKDDQVPSSPVITINKRPLKLLNIPIDIDFLAMIHQNTKCSKSYNILVESVSKHLRLYESELHRCLKVKLEKFDSSTPLFLKTYHFFPSECGHFITRVIFNESPVISWQQRLAFHNTLLISRLYPVFRRANQYEFEARTNGPLRNPHIGVKLISEVSKMALIRGNYEYYHYGQNGMNDNGWGCAYRSLQTLASWFKLQAYTDKPVPTILDIQKCLVDINDKPSSFINSREWIGSMEVNFVLSSLFGVTSKILSITSGEAISNAALELFNHFTTNGSPVMIGGGVLAHTILGVAFIQDQNSIDDAGTVKFLVLDPHYTGDEDLHTIQNKGWCGWKTADFWKKNTFYNMCLPQVAQDI